MPDNTASETPAADTAARSFGPVAAAYESGRPGYPEEVVAWLLAVHHSTAPQPARGLQVIELGAGTGKLTEGLIAAGADVFATDPDDAMLDILSRKFPEVRVTLGTAEQIPAPDSSADLVVVGAAFHWFDPALALPEIARVLKEGGQLALCWTEYDLSIPWVRKYDRITGHTVPYEQRDPTSLLERSGLFSAVAESSFSHWQRVNRETLLDLTASRSSITTMDEGDRAAVLAEVAALYDDYGRRQDGMQLPLVTRCFRTTVVPKPQVTEVSLISTGSQAAATDGTDTGPEATVAVQKPDQGTTLLNFS